MPTGADIDHVYYRDIRRFPILKDEEVRRFYLAPDGAYRTPSSAEIDYLISCHLRLVVHKALNYYKRCKPHHLGVMDFIQEGNIGLVKGALRFDPVYGTKFTTFVGQKIIGQMRTALQEQDGLVRIKCGMRQKIRKVKKF